jgi:hypothetical protein
LQIFGLVGLMTLLPGSAICFYLVIARLFLGQSLADRPLFSLGILLTVVGVQFISMGLLAEIQIRTYHESSNKPIYSVLNTLDSQRGEMTKLSEVNREGVEEISKPARRMASLSKE